MSGYNYPLAFCNIIFDTFCNINLTQLVDFPTRNNNILDIFATNRPSLVTHCTPLPGINDHDIIYVESSVRAEYILPTKRKITLWSRADINCLSNFITNFNESFLSCHSSKSPVQLMWEEFKAMCLDCINLIPTKFVSVRYNKPWITIKTKQIIRKKKRLYNRARLSGSIRDWNAYHAIKKSAPYECRKAHDDYLMNLANSELNDSNKRLWSYIKSQQKEHSGIPSLEVDGKVITDPAAKANELNKFLVQSLLVKTMNICLLLIFNI